MNRELRELREDVDNDGFDKRRKFGEDSFPIFKAGTRFLLVFHEDGKCAGLPKIAQLVDRDLDNKEIIVSGGKLVKLFYASSREVTPRSIDDLVATHEVSRKSILDELLTQGRITIVDVDQACMAIRERQRQKKTKSSEPTPTDITSTNTPTAPEVK
jgi:hypothetical protein